MTPFASKSANTFSVDTAQSRLDAIQDLVITSERAAELLGRSTQTISRLVKEGIIASIKISSGLYLLDRTQVEVLSHKFTRRKVFHAKLREG